MGIAGGRDSGFVPNIFLATIHLLEDAAPIPFWPMPIGTAMIRKTLPLLTSCRLWGWELSRISCTTDNWERKAMDISPYSRTDSSQLPDACVATLKSARSHPVCLSQSLPSPGSANRSTEHACGQGSLGSELNQLRPCCVVRAVFPYFRVNILTTLKLNARLCLFTLLTSS